MIVSPDPQSGPASLIGIEAAFTLLAAVIAVGWPKIASGFFRRVETTFGNLARRKVMAVAVVGLTALLVRLAILPLCPVPHPFSPDDFSNLLVADTVSHGRLTNPTPAMWVHFETIHVSMTPTYTSMYFPAEGLVLAAGKVLTGVPWFGILFMSALMCAAICWMLQAWLPPGWALLGGMLAVLRISLFSYWSNTYTGAAPMAALGGALVLGALPRLKRNPQLRYAMLMTLGVILLANTRPYEGVLLCLPVTVALALWLWRGKNRPQPAALLRLATLPLLTILAAGAWMGYYNYRAFGSPLTLPYTLNRNQYATARYFVWQSPRPEPAYHHPTMRRFYREGELLEFKDLQSNFLFRSSIKIVEATLFFCGFAFLWNLLMIRRVLMDRRTRFLMICTAVLLAGMVIQVFFIAHYVAPFTAVFYALGLQAMRHLRAAGDMGRSLVRLTVCMCLLLATARLFAGPLRLHPSEWPASRWQCNSYGPIGFGKERANIETTLEEAEGKHLVIVRYSPAHYPFDEWVYNGRDLNDSKVIWAREMDPASNLNLIRHYSDRQVWLVEPDTNPAKVSPYPIPDAPRSLSAQGSAPGLLAGTPPATVVAGN